MSKTRDTGFLGNVVKVDASGNVSFVSGSTTLATINTTGQLSGSSPVLSASYASNAETLDGLDSTVFTLTSSFNAQTASFTAFSSSINSFSASILSYTASQNITNGTFTTTASFNAQTASFTAFTASILATTSSLNSFSASILSYTASINAKTASFATTGSNTFVGNQVVSGSFTTSGSITSTSTITAQTLVVQTITSSVVYSSGSNIFGNDISNSQTFTGSVLVTGSLTISTGGNASAPIIFGSTITCSPIGCFATSCATSFIGGTMSGTTIYGSTAVCSPVGKFTSCIDAGAATFSNNLTLSNASSTTDLGGVLIVRGNGSAHNTHYLTTGAANVAKYIQYNASGTAINLIDAGGVSYINGGNVLIGKTTNAGGKLQVSNGTVTFNVDHNADGPYLTGATDNNVNYKKLSYDACEHIFLISATEKMRITSTGAATFSGTVNVYDGSSHGLSISNSSGAITFTNNWAKTTFTVGSAQDIEFNDDAGIKRLFLSTGGSVGIGTVSPGAKLDICQLGGDNTRTCHALYLRAGNNSDVFNSNQILFSYNGTTDYAHAIKTRHNSNNAIDNAIDFYMWKYGDAAATKAGQYVMTIAGNGRIGIGTCQPQFTIDLSSGDTTRVIQFYGGSDTDKYGIGKFAGSGATTVFHGGAGASNRVSLGCYNGTTYTPNFEVLGNGVICMINIGSGAGTYALKWNSSTKNVTYDTSSERYKNNIRNSIYGLSDIMKLNSKMFEYKDTGRTDIGLIAEEVYPIIPELVLLDENSLPNGVSYDRMVSILTRGMQEQQCTINTLKTCLGIA